MNLKIKDFITNEAKTTLVFSKLSVEDNKFDSPSDIGSAGLFNSIDKGQTKGPELISLSTLEEKMDGTTLKTGFNLALDMFKDNAVPAGSDFTNFGLAALSSGSDAKKTDIGTGDLSLRESVTFSSKSGPTRGTGRNVPTGGQGLSSASQKSEDRGQKSEDGSQRTEDRKQRTDVREQNTGGVRPSSSSRIPEVPQQSTQGPGGTTPPNTGTTPHTIESSPVSQPKTGASGSSSSSSQDASCVEAKPQPYQKSGVNESATTAIVLAKSSLPLSFSRMPVSDSGGENTGVVRGGADTGGVGTKLSSGAGIEPSSGGLAIISSIHDEKTFSGAARDKIGTVFGKTSVKLTISDLGFGNKEEFRGTVKLQSAKLGEIPPPRGETTAEQVTEPLTTIKAPDNGLTATGAIAILDVHGNGAALQFNFLSGDIFNNREIDGGILNKHDSLSRNNGRLSLGLGLVGLDGGINPFSTGTGGDRLNSSTVENRSFETTNISVSDIINAAAMSGSSVSSDNKPASDKEGQDKTRLVLSDTSAIGPQNQWSSLLQSNDGSFITTNTGASASLLSSTLSVSSLKFNLSGDTSNVLINYSTVASALADSLTIGADDLASPLFDPYIKLELSTPSYVTLGTLSSLVIKVGQLNTIETKIKTQSVVGDKTTLEKEIKISASLAGLAEKTIKEFISVIEAQIGNINSLKDVKIALSKDGLAVISFAVDPNKVTGSAKNLISAFISAMGKDLKNIKGEYEILPGKLFYIVEIKPENMSAV